MKPFRRMVFLPILLFAQFAWAQDSGAGRITLTFRGETTSLPVRSVAMQKSGTIAINAMADTGRATRFQLGLNLTLKELAAGPDVLDLSQCTLNFTRTERDTAGGHQSAYLTLRFGDQSANYAVITKTKRTDWAIESGTAHIALHRVTYERNALRIVGEFSSWHTARRGNENADMTITISDGFFEIVL